MTDREGRLGEGVERRAVGDMWNPADEPRAVGEAKEAGVGGLSLCGAAHEASKKRVAANLGLISAGSTQSSEHCFGCN
ncbi:MAG: hypothetical protein VCC04_04370, partial [Myxococcota bacterium]